MSLRRTRGTSKSNRNRAETERKKASAGLLESQMALDENAKSYTLLQSHVTGYGGLCGTIEDHIKKVVNEIEQSDVKDLARLKITTPTELRLFRPAILKLEQHEEGCKRENSTDTDEDRTVKVEEPGINIGGTATDHEGVSPKMESIVKKEDSEDFSWPAAAPTTSLDSGDDSEPSQNPLDPLPYLERFRYQGTKVSFETVKHALDEAFTISLEIDAVRVALKTALQMGVRSGSDARSSLLTSLQSLQALWNADYTEYLEEVQKMADRDRHWKKASERWRARLTAVRTSTDNTQRRLRQMTALRTETDSQGYIICSCCDLDIGYIQEIVPERAHKKRKSGV